MRDPSGEKVGEMERRILAILATEVSSSPGVDGFLLELGVDMEVMDSYLRFFLVRQVGSSCFFPCERVLSPARPLADIETYSHHAPFTMANGGEW